MTIVAERAAWIRVYRADKSVIFEKILETGETYSPPPETSAPLIWAGNSGSVYVRIGEQLRGPLGPGTKAVRDVPLDPAALSGSLPAVSMAARSDLARLRCGRSGGSHRGPIGRIDGAGA